MQLNRILNTPLPVVRTRPVGRLKKRWLDNVKEDCQTIRLTLEVSDRTARHGMEHAVRRLLERVDMSIDMSTRSSSRQQQSTSQRH